jgi:hypothetical protein
MFQELTQIGGRSSYSKENTSLISKTRRQLMSIRTRILRDKRLSSGEDTMAGTKDGELSMLTKQRRKEVQDGIQDMDSTSIDHSSSDQNFQCGELLKLLDLMLDSEDITFQEEDNKLSNLTEYPIPSSLCITLATHLTLPAMVKELTLESQQPIQDGGRCSE